MLSVVGIGPGSLDLLTERARARISSADVIMGNERYIGLIKEIIPTSAELIIGKMGTEVERAKKAVELGNRKNVVIVSGGDPGIYGMAGLTLEVAGDLDIGVEIVPGITAASAAAALLGAPLSNDFAVLKQSKAIVAKIVSKYPLSEHERRVAGRVVFANADPSFMDLIVFKHNPIERGIQCIHDGKTIITDIEMVKAGISKRYKENVTCFVNNPKTMGIAVKENLTRTAAGFRIAKELIRDNIVAIGNAPSTCLELSALIKEGIKPALIIATPVGFVNAAESKEDMLSTDIPCIVIRGPRGGTPSAVAIINAIIKLSFVEAK